MSETNVVYDSGDIEFVSTNIREYPKIVLNWPEDEPFRLPIYLVHSDELELTHGVFTHSKEEQNELRRSGVFGVAALAIQAATDSLGKTGVSIDHELFRDAIPEMNTSNDLVLGIGFYVSLLGNAPQNKYEASTQDSLVVYQKTRDDMRLLLSKAYELCSGMSEADEKSFYVQVSENLMPTKHDSLSYSSKMIRDTLFDIVGNPVSPTDPPTVFGTNLLRRSTIESDSSHSYILKNMQKGFINNPRYLIRNPELYFIFEHSLSNKQHIKRQQAEEIVGGMVNSFFSRIEQIASAGSFEKNVATAYRKIVNKIHEKPTSSRSIIRTSTLFMPTAVTNLAIALSNATNDVNKKLVENQVHVFTGSLEYILQTLETEGGLDNLWPGVEPDTRQNFIKRLVNIAKLIP